MPDVREFTKGILKNPEDDTRRLVFADWLDEHHPATPVERTLPTGFCSWWSVSGNSDRHKGLRYEPFGRWSKGDVWDALQSLTVAGHWPRWCDHPGATVIAGVPAAVGEPYAKAEDLLPACRVLQDAIRCPVSVARAAFHHAMCSRLIIWFTEGFVPPPQQPTKDRAYFRRSARRRS